MDERRTERGETGKTRGCSHRESTDGRAGGTALERQAGKLELLCPSRRSLVQLFRGTDLMEDLTTTRMRVPKERGGVAEHVHTDDTVVEWGAELDTKKAMPETHPTTHASSLLSCAEMRSVLHRTWLCHHDTRLCSRCRKRCTVAEMNVHTVAQGVSRRLPRRAILAQQYRNFLVLTCA